jgi:hypothetical protein
MMKRRRSGEGAVGVSAILATPNPSVTMVVADIDPLFRMTANAYRAEMDRRGAFYEILTRYSQVMIGFVMQSSACNAVHRLEQRLARWLLLARDRIESDQFPMTQEFLAMMLGASRPDRDGRRRHAAEGGLDRYHRGQITIVDGEALENASCECYRTATELLNGVTVRRSIRIVSVDARPARLRPPGHDLRHATPHHPQGRHRHANRRSRRRLHSNPYARRRCPGSIPAPTSRTIAVTGTMMADEEGASSAPPPAPAPCIGSMIPDAHCASR